MWGKLRRAAAGLLAGCAALASGSAAAALTVSPSGSYRTFGGVPVRFQLSSNGQRLACDTSMFPQTISSTGAGSVASGGAVFTRCSNSLIGPFTFTQTRAWTMQVTLTLAPFPMNWRRVWLRYTIPAGGLTLRAGACTVTFNGAFGMGYEYPSLPATVNTTDLFLVYSSGLTVDGAIGCSPLLAVVGLTATYDPFSQHIDRPMTVSG